jgi:hypothetical protein
MEVLTMNDSQREFIQHVKSITQNWNAQNLSKEQTVDGVVFSLLNALDERYFVIPENIIVDVRADNISGCLHELWATQNKE